jgi:PAS domain S-box-containing protein
MDTKPTYEELEARVKELEAMLEKRTHELTREITEFIEVKSDLEKRTFELSQRIRELKSVLEITTASDLPDLTLPGFYMEVLKIVAASFQYPDVTCAELRVGNEEYRTNNFLITPWRIGRGLMEGSDMIGYLTVYYTEERPEGDFGPFTKEEKNLMVVLTRYLVQIIKRKKTEEQVRKFEELTEQSPSWIIITDASGIINYINPAFSQTLGYSRGETIGKTIDFAERSPENLAIYSDLQKALTEGRVWRGQIRSIRKDGAVIWLSLTIFPIILDGIITGFVATGSEITYQKELEAQKQEQAEKYRILAENLPLSVAILDRDTRCLFSNQLAVKLFGQGHPLDGRTTQEIFPPNVSDEITAEIHEVIRTGKPMSMERTYTRDGQKIHYRTHRIPLFDESGEVYGVLIIAEDITEAKRQEFLLRIQHKIDSLASVSTSLNSSIKKAFKHLLQIDWLDGGGIYLFDDDEKYLRLVYSEGLMDEFVRQVSVYSRDAEPVRLILMKKPVVSKIHEVSRMNKDALVKEGLNLAISIPLIYEDHVIGCLNLGSKKLEDIRDNDRMVIESIAARLANLIVLIRTREKLETANLKLKESLRDVKEKQEMLTQKSKLESLGELAAGLAHEINQPLSVIGLAFENINYKLSASAENKDYFLRKTETIGKNIEKIRQLIEHVRIFSRDQSTVMFEKFDVNMAVKESIGLAETQLRKQNIAVNLDLCREKCTILGNLTKMEQVIMNLVSNSRDAVEEKAALPHYTGLKKLISIHTYTEDSKIIIIVEDNGIGIQSENLPKVLTPFYTTKPPGQGTGLGLPIVYGIVTEMKGTVEISSEPEKFTQIRLTFPKL